MLAGLAVWHTGTDGWKLEHLYNSNGVLK